MSYFDLYSYYFRMTYILSKMVKIFVELIKNEI